MILCIEITHNEFIYTRLSPDLSQLLEKNSVLVESPKRDQDIGSYLKNYKTELINLLSIYDEPISAVCIKQTEPLGKPRDNTIKRIMVEGIFLELLHDRGIKVFYPKSLTIKSVLGVSPDRLVNGKENSPNFSSASWWPPLEKKYRKPTILAFAYKILEEV